MRWNYTFKEQIINARLGFYLGGGTSLLMAVFMGPAFSLTGEVALWGLAVACIAIGLYGTRHRP